MKSATQPWRPWLERTQALWLGSSLPAFVHWWAAELRLLMPTPWRDWFRAGAQWFLLQPDAAGWTLRRSGGVEPLSRWNDADAAAGPLPELRRALGTVDPADLRLALLLPDQLVLRRTLTLPLAARSNLRQVLGFEMDRQTPFQLAQVFYAARSLVTSAPAGQFQAELLAVPSSTLDPLLAQLNAQGLTVDAVDVAAGTGRLGVNLLPPARVPQHAHPLRRRNLLLGAACIGLLALVLGTWLHQRRTALAAMQVTVDAMRGDAQQVAALRQQLQDNAGAAGFLAQRKRQSVPMLGVLQEATARLPEAAWLERFSVDNTGQIGLQGQSQQASRLLDALKDSPLIADANFQGSIQPDPATGKERFYLVAQVRQPAIAPARSGTGAPSSGQRQ